MADFTDTIDVTDYVFTGLAGDAADAIDVSDSVLALRIVPIVALKISHVRALTETRVRIDFDAPTSINEALTNPSSYSFSNPSPGSVEVTPLAVTLPPGQVNPLYVEIATTEHTNNLNYEVALSPALRGALGEIGHIVPVAYVAIGAGPTLQLVLATSAIEVQVHFSEPIANNASARDQSKYVWAGDIATVDVLGVVGNVVTLQTTAQTPGQLYTLTVVGEG